MILGFGNNVVSSLASDITASQTTFSVIPGDGQLFAALLTSDFSNKSTALKNYAKITLTDSGETAFEVCHLTAVNGDTLTVIRGQEGTAAKGWSLKDVVANFATRGSENAFPQIAHIQSGFYTSGTAGGTANALTLELPTTFFLNGSADWVLKTPIVVYPSQNNTGTATLQLTMGDRVLGTFKLYKGNKAELVANDILKDVALVCLMDGTKTFFNVANPGAIYAGLGTAAFRDAQTSKDDITAGRLLVNGGALALRTTLAGAGRPLTDFNDLPANSVSFGYDNATNTPGFTGSVLDYAGSSGNYRVQLAAQYNGNGNRIAFRTRNGDSGGAWNAWGEIYHTRNKPSASDVGALPSNGNAVSATKLQTARTIGGVAFDGTANINLPGVNTGGNQSTTGNAATATRLQTARTINGVSFNGTANITIPASAIGSYTKAESDARYGIVNGIRRGGQQVRNPTDAWFENWESPAGCVVTGIQMSGRSDGRKLGVYFRQMQYLNKQTGAWVNIGD